MIQLFKRVKNDSNVANWSMVPDRSVLSNVAYSGNYSDLNGTPDLSVYAEKSELANVATSGNYSDLIDTPNLSVYAEKDDLANIAFSGNYSDLIGAPELANVALSGNYSDLAGTPNLSVYAEKSELANVAFSGNYSDLNGTPVIPVVDYPVTDVTVNGTSAMNGSVAEITVPSVPSNISAFTNDVGYITDSALSGYAQTADLANIAFSGNYSDLVGAPVLANVATSGSYTDLTDKPTIPAAQVQSDWDQADNTAVDYIKNKPDLSVYALSSSLANVATSGNYSDLNGKPTIPDVSNMVTTNTSQTITGVKTIDADINYTSPSLSMRGIKNNGSGYGINLQNNSSSNIISIYVNKPTIGSAELGITPRVANCDLGGSGTTSNYKWRNLYLSGNISDGSNNISVAGMVAKQNAINASNKLSADYVSGLANVATTGNYSDLAGTPTLATVATTGNYSDLIGTPDLSIYAQTANLSNVAFSGNYSDLSGTPASEPLYKHILTLKNNETASSASAIATAEIVTNSSTQFTIESLMTWLYDHNYKTVPL